MRHSLLPVFALGGCLYVGGINHAPDGEVRVEQQGAQQGDWVVVTADVRDEDGDDVRYQWVVEVQPSDGAAPTTLTLHEESGASDGGPSYAIQPVGEGLSSVKVYAEHRGGYQVKLRALDSRGAYRDFQTSFTVVNQPPTIGLLLDVEPAYKLTDRYPDTGYTDGKVRNPAHAHYLVALDSNKTTDHENDLQCGGGATITYELVKPAMALTDYWERVPCQAGELLDRLRFRFDPAKVTQPEQVEIKVTVDDGHGGVVHETVTLDVVPNRPACIVRGQYNDGTSPPMPDEAGGLEVPVVAEEGLTFEVRFPDDDVDEGHTYTWLVRDSGSQSFELLQQQQGTGGAKLKLSPWFRMPGQQVELRAAIADQVLGTSLPGCQVDQDLCREDGADLPTSPTKCYQWVTWKLMFY